ncbi:hypothetical protein HL670_01090 [Serratia plymuthica]|nr:hypothetical protein HL670_01090 [Serratia plymuthica]
MGFILYIGEKNMPGGVNNYTNTATQTGYDCCADLLLVSLQTYTSLLRSTYHRLMPASGSCLS